MSSSTLAIILHCQKQLKKGVGEGRLLHYLRRLSRLRIRLRHLQETGIGKTVNQLARLEGPVGSFAEGLVADWKKVVEEESEVERNRRGSSTEEEEEEEEDSTAIKRELEMLKEEYCDEEDDSENELVIASSPEVNNNRQHEEDSSEEEEVRVKREASEEEDTRVKSERYSSEEDSPRVSSSSSILMKKEVSEEGHSHRTAKVKEEECSEEPPLPRHQSYKQVRVKIKEEPSSSEEEQPPHHNLKKVKVKEEDVSVRETEPKSKHQHKARVKLEVVEPRTHRHSAKYTSKSTSQREEGVKSRPEPKQTHSHKRQKTEADSKPDVSLLNRASAIDSTSGLGFEAVMGCLDRVKPVMKRGKSSSSKEKRSDKTTGRRPQDSSSSSPEKKTKLNGDSSVPLDPHYKPNLASRLPPPPTKTNILRGFQFEEEPSSSRPLSPDQLSSMITSRKNKTKVYSGTAKQSGPVPSLFSLCLTKIQDHIEDLGYTGGVPFEILKPVLERATPNQLYNIEMYNEYLIESTGDLWEFHCRRDFKPSSSKEKRSDKSTGRRPQDSSSSSPEKKAKLNGGSSVQKMEFESWREFYQRCLKEREMQFEEARKNVREKVKNKPNEKKAKLAYLEAGTSKGATKYGERKEGVINEGMRSLKTKELEAGQSKHKLKVEEASVVIRAGATARAGTTAGRDNNNSPAASAKKQKKAPLMQKTFKLLKSLRR